MKKEALIQTKPGKYFMAKQKGKNKTEAKIEAGYALTTQTNQIEKSETYNEIEKRFYKDALLEKVALSELADELVKIIKQDGDLGAKNTAIKTALERIEPDKQNTDEPDKVVVVLRN